MSDNPVKWWDNRKAAYLGFRPNDSSSDFAASFPLSADRPDDGDLTSIYQGGPFVVAGPKY
jgi:uronate dehydrogenase